MFLKCAAQSNVVSVLSSLGGTESDFSATPTVDGDRGDPIPDQGYIKKKKKKPYVECKNCMYMCVYIYGYVGMCMCVTCLISKFEWM